jgi:hypothetical protein
MLQEISHSFLINVVSDPSFSSVLTLDPVIVVLLLCCPGVQYGAFEEGVPTDKVLGSDKVIDSWPSIWWVWRRECVLLAWSLLKIAWWISGIVLALRSHVFSSATNASHVFCAFGAVQNTAWLVSSNAAQQGHDRIRNRIWVRWCLCGRHEILLLHLPLRQ